MVVIMVFSYRKRKGKRSLRTPKQWPYNPTIYISEDDPILFGQPSGLVKVNMNSDQKCSRLASEKKNC